MRLIDADALKDRLQALSYDDWNQGVSTTWANAYAECADMVGDMPTIEPERKKGKWIPITKGERGYSAGDFRCSVCHQPNKCYTITNYCSHCGAYMKSMETNNQ